MTSSELKDRTKNFALSIINLTDGINRNTASEVLKKQIIRSATSIGANYRSACRAKSKADFAPKVRIALEEADEKLNTG
jgi:four helix bundle protein